MRSLALCLLLFAPVCVDAGTVLFPNGSFDDAKDPLAGWQTRFEQKGESWYFDNHKYVSVLPEESGRKTVLRLNVATQFLADFPGIKVESAPTLIQPGHRYRFSAWARSTGPDSRVMIEGYKWRPDVSPHPNPTIYELRKCYRFEQLYFGEVAGGTTGSAGREWKKASMEIPNKPVKDLKELQLKLYNEIQFFVIHIVAITGKSGELFVDDVVLERMD